MIAAVTALLDIGNADRPGKGGARFGMCHQDYGDFVLRVCLYGDGVGIVGMCFPFVNGLDI